MSVSIAPASPLVKSFFSFFHVPPLPPPAGCAIIDAIVSRAGGLFPCHPFTFARRSPEDAGELLSIYRPYVEHTAVTFEYAVPTRPSSPNGCRDTLATHPYLVAEAEGTLLGYAYAAPFHPRAAYQWAAETTIYLRQDQRGRGLGRPAIWALEALLHRPERPQLQRLHRPAPVEDETLTLASLRFHPAPGLYPGRAVSSVRL